MDKRQSFIMAALCGWKGDDPCVWQSPIDEETLISWAKSHCTPDLQKEDFRVELTQLIEEGLFFQVHPGVFESPVYYCSYDHNFLAEIFSDEEPEYFDLWKDWAAEDDKQFKEEWRKYGVCSGGGSQSGSNPPDICRGKECVWYVDGDSMCNWELKFKR